MEIVRPEPWMTPPAQHCKIQYMHSDQVQKLPPESAVLARAPHCEVAMFRVGDSMLGIEGHPEFPASYVTALLNERKSRIGEDVTRKALAHVDEPTHSDIVASWIRNFIGGGEHAK
jgi:GMP synthase-like glutamine amidotransferase